MPDDNDDRIKRLEKRFRSFDILGGPDVSVAGSIASGYAVTIKRVLPGAGAQPPPPPGMGACCVGNICSIQTGTDCANMGGTYLGDGSVCTPDTCAPGECPAISFVCDSVSATLTKCGFDEFVPSDPPKLYLTKTDDWVMDFFCDNFNSESMTRTCAATWTGQSEIVSTVDPQTCDVIPGVCTVISPGNIATSSDVGGPCADCNTPFDACALPTIAMFGYAPVNACSGLDAIGEFNVGTGGSTTPTVSTSTWDSFFCPGSGIVNVGGITHTTTLTDEYTTALLKSNTIAALPDYSGDFDNTSCTSSANLATDENTYAITRFEYKFTFPAVANNFQIDWDVVCSFDAGGGSTTHHSTVIGAGETESAVFICTEPSENGTCTVANIRCTPV